jgi:hypothetical protein
MWKWLVLTCLLPGLALAQGSSKSIPGSGNGIPDPGCTANQIAARNAGNTAWVCTTNTSGGAPTNSGYWISNSSDDAGLSSENLLGALTTALIINTSGVPSAYAGTSCTNQFFRSMGATGIAGCQSVSLSADVTGVLPTARGGTGTANAIDNSTLIGNGSIWLTAVIPNCSSTTASKLLYDATSRSFTCGIDQNNSAGTGNVVGPASAVAGGLTFFSGTTGKLLTDASTLGLTPATLYVPQVDSSGGTTMAPVSGTGGSVNSINPFLIAPFILGFDSANHDHSNTTNGGQLNLNTAHNDAFGPLAVSHGGTGTTTSTGTGNNVLSAGPALTGIPTAPKAADNDNSTQIASTSYVQTEVHEIGGIGPTELASTLGGAGVSCSNCNVTFDADGRATAAVTGTAGSGSGITQIGDCSTSPCYQTEAQNKVYAAPVGATGQLSSRLLVDADIPTGITGSKIGAGISATNVTTGTLPVARFNSGTNADATHFLRGDGTWQVPPGTGTVTSVDLSVPASSIFASSGGPVTSTGTLALATNGTSGGIPYFSSATQLSTSAQLAANQLVLGKGAAVAPATLGSLGTTTTLLHGNAAGAPTFAAVNIAAGGDTTGTLPVASGGTGVITLTNGGVLLGTGSGNIHATAVLTNGQMLIGDGTTDPAVGTITGTAAQIAVTTGIGTLQLGFPNDVTVNNNLAVNNTLSVASQADGSNGLDMYNNTGVMQAGSSGHCGAAFVGSRFSKRCNGVATATPYANIVAEGTLALNLTAVNTGTCGTAQTSAATGTLTTDTIIWVPNAVVAAPNGLLTRNVYPTADTVNVVVCNPTAGNLTPTAMTINYKVIR